MKKILMLLTLLAISGSLISCGDFGAGIADVPAGENPGIPSVVQLTPAQYIAQTNGRITLNAKILDGNGMAVSNETVTFTNLSLLGTLSSTTAVTNSLGLATVNLSSTAAGFATVTAQVYTGAGEVRDRKTVYFTSSDTMDTVLTLGVDSSPGNGVYNETADITLFQTATDDTVDLLATVYTAGGAAVVAGTTVAWGSSFPTETTFTRQETITDSLGRARATARIAPMSLRNSTTAVNITASAGNGAATMTTLFLNAVTISPALSTVTAAPSVVNLSGTSTITATVLLNTGAAAPNNTSVSFTTTCGTVTSFAQTTGGVATAAFTAPATLPAGGTCTVTAAVSGTTVGTAVITITTPLAVTPSAINVNGIAGGTATFTVNGGVPGYTITRNNAAAWTAPVPATVAASGGTFVVTVPANTPTTTVTYTIRDSVGTTVTATLTVTGAALAITPGTAVINTGVACNTAPGVNPAQTYTITGGAAPYNLVTSNSTVTSFTAPTAGNTTTVAASGGTFTIANDVTIVATGVAVTITATDALNTVATATLTINCP